MAVSRAMNVDMACGKIRAFAALPLMMGIAGLLGAGAAHAQSLPQSTAPTGVEIDPNRVFGDDAPSARGLDVLAGFGLGVSASLVTEWSDNVVRRSDELQLQGGYESRSDWVFRPNLSISAGRPIGRQQLFANLSVGRDFYARNTILNRSRADVNGGVAWNLGVRCSGRVQGGYATRGTQFDLFEDVVPSTQDTVNFFANASCSTPGGLTPSISYDWYKTSNKTDSGFLDRDFADVRSQGISAGLGYRLSTRGEVGIQGQWRTLTYPNQLLITGETNGTKYWGGSAYANYRIGPSLSFNGSLGFTKVDPKSEFSDDFSGTTWNVGLNYSGPRLGASISGGRSVSGSSGGFANYQIATSYGANVSYKAGTRMGVSAGFNKSQTESRGAQDIPQSQFLTEYDLDRWYAGIDWRFNRLLSASLDLNHQKRTSVPADFNYDATTVSLGLRASF